MTWGKKKRSSPSLKWYRELKPQGWETFGESALLSLGLRGLPPRQLSRVLAYKTFLILSLIPHLLTYELAVNINFLPCFDQLVITILMPSPSDTEELAFMSCFDVP